MKIRQLQLIGFKSFAEKVTLSFHKGITCIVGPNGCGKSNIVDAFRWVLGEQSAKSLRGDKMEEVIFQGTAQRKPRGMAEVSLSFDKNGDDPQHNSLLPTDNSSHKEPDVTVCRRLYRSGESEYLIGNKQCRLKDIRDLFLDTGLDVKSYSILDQGRIADIVNAKPIERRFVIEEVAGVMKYKVRKAEAMAKLDSAKQNLQRINDIVYEVKRQISSLDRQVKKAERYQRLIDELKDLELRTFKRNHTALSLAFEGLNNQLNALQQQESIQRAEIATIELENEKNRIALTEKEKRNDLLLKQLADSKNKISEAEKRKAILKSSIENDKANIASITKQAIEAEAKKEELKDRLNEFLDAEKNLIASIKDTAVEFEHKKKLLEESANQLADLESNIESLRKELFKHNDWLSARKNEYLAISASIDKLNHQISAAQKDIDSIHKEIARIQENIKKAEEQLAVKSTEHQEFTVLKSQAKNDINNAEHRLNNLRNELSRLREAVASNTARMQSLQELSVDKTITDLIKELRAKLQHQLVLLSDFITTEKGYEQAAEAALSDKVNAIVLKRYEDVISTAEFIKRQKLGRTAIFYMYESSPVVNKPQVVNELILGGLSDFIKVDSNVCNLSKLVNTYVVKTLSDALKILPETAPLGISIVTLEGELIMPDGSIFIGKGREILKTKREIRELQGLIAQHQQEIVSTEQAITQAQQNLAMARDTLKTYTTKVINIEREQSLLHQSIKTSQDELQRNDKRLGFLQSDINTFTAELSSLTSTLKSKNNEVLLLQTKIDELNEKLTQMNASLQSAKKTYNEDLAVVHDMELMIATSTERINAVKSDIFNTTEALQECEEKITSAALNISSISDRITKSHNELEDIDILLKQLITNAETLTTESLTVKQEIDTDLQNINESADKLKTLRVQIDALTAELNSVKNAVFEHTLKIQNISDAVHQKYGISIQDAQIDHSQSTDEEDLKLIEAINEKIRDLGPVNMGTIEEYSELKTRYEFLNKQQEDLTKSIAELEEAINRINTTTRKKLREAYDQLRGRFSQVFHTLFGGGRADLVLTDEGDILESGIDIIAQPPGKKLQNLTLLSGGEKALTSLSLLFAGFLIKPSPLCILDEADAPLDESNTVRFINMLKELSKETQFIIITHNRLSMEAADYIYGVTSEDQGVSKVISLRFSDIDDDTVQIN